VGRRGEDRCLHSMVTLALRLRPLHMHLWGVLFTFVLIILDGLHGMAWYGLVWSGIPDQHDRFHMVLRDQVR
jgi:hypothetical protein